MDIYCHKLKKTAPRMPRQPFPGELGEKIYNEISDEAWQLWILQQTMLINEHRLSVMEPAAQRFLREKMVAFLFEGEDVKPKLYQPR